jgi:putative membrane protein
MPDTVINDLWGLIPSIVYFVVAILLFGLSIWLMDILCPFSIRKEIEEDQNTSLGIIMGSAIIGIAIVLAAVVK